MEADFWHARWDKGEIAFHEQTPNRHLQAHFSAMCLTPGNRVFAPLCGKTSDLLWLADQGFEVVGIELNRGAVTEFFEEAKLEPRVTVQEPFEHFVSANIEILVGDFFALESTVLGLVDAVYDRAALIALPRSMRNDYTQHLSRITARAPQFLISIEYAPGQTEGPPFSVPADEIREHYGKNYQIKQLASTAISGPLAKRCSGEEIAWQLTSLVKSSQRE